MNSPKNEQNFGMSIFLVNGTDQRIINHRKVKTSINATFKAYRQHLLNENLLSNLKDNYCYLPISFQLFGHFDFAFIYFHDSSEFNNKYLHPYNILNPIESSALYDYKLITGYKKISIIKDTYKRIQQKIKDRFVVITRLKINPLLSIGNGGAIVRTIKEGIKGLAIKNKQLKHFKDINPFIMESFGFSELVLITASADIIELTKYLVTVKELSLGQIEELHSENSNANNKIRISSLANRVKLDSEDLNIFDKASSLIGHSNAALLNNKDIKYNSFWSIYPGFIRDFYTNLKASNSNKSLGLLYGGRDIKSYNFYNSDDTEFAHRFIEENKFNIEDVITRVVLPTKKKEDFFVHLKGAKKINRKEIQKFYSKQLFEPLEIDRVLELGKFIGLSNVILQRIVSNIINFNKSISDPSNFSFFIESKEYLRNNLFNSILYESERLKNDVNHFYKFSIEKFETEIIHIIKGFETSFSNRYFHSHSLALHTDFNYSYKGGIQQYLIVYEFLFATYCKELYENESNSVSLYVSAYSITKSSPYWTRMNIFHVNEPGLFLSIMAHEASIHILDKIITKIYASLYLGNDVGSKFFSKTNSSKKEIIIYLAKIGYSGNDNDLRELLFLVTDKKERRALKKDGENKNVTEFDRMSILYLMSDIISLKTTFKGEMDLFYWWAFVHFSQIIDFRANRKESNEHLISILYRFKVLAWFENSENEFIEFVKLFKIEDEMISETNDLFNKNNAYKNDLIMFFGKLASDLSTGNKAPKDPPYFVDENHFYISRDIISNKCCNKDISRCILDISHDYLSTIYKRTKNSTIYIDQSLELIDNKEYLIIDPHGGLIYKGEELRQFIFHTKTKYIKTMWHLTQLEKAHTLSRYDKKKNKMHNFL